MDNNYKFNPETGEPIVNETASEQPVYTAPEQPIENAAPQYDAAPQYQTPAEPTPAPTTSKGKAIAGMIVAICGLCLSWLGISFCWPGIFSLAASIVGWQLSKGLAPFSKVGKICGIIGMILSILFMIIGLILVLVVASSGGVEAFDELSRSMY